MPRKTGRNIEVEADVEMTERSRPRRGQKSVSFSKDERLPRQKTSLEEQIDEVEDSPPNHPRQPRSSSSKPQPFDSDSSEAATSEDEDSEGRDEIGSPIQKSDYAKYVERRNSRRESVMSTDSSVSTASNNRGLTRQSSRYEDRLRDESAHVDQELDEYRERRSSRRTLTDVPVTRGDASEVEAYDFFTKTFDDVKRGDSDDGGGGDDDEGVSEDDKKPLVKDIVGGFDEWTVLEPARATFSKASDAKGLYFVPPTSQIEAADKLNHGDEPRFMEEEGYYVGTKPYVPQKLRNKAEHR